MNCRGCEKREFCSVLCPEAEMFVNQDYVSQRELTIGNVRTGRFPKAKRDVKFTEKEKQIVTLIILGKTYLEVAKVLNIKYENVRKIMSRMFKKLA